MDNKKILEIKKLVEKHQAYIEQYKNNEKIKRSYFYKGQLIKQLQIISALCKETGLSYQQYDDEIKLIQNNFFN